MMMRFMVIAACLLGTSAAAEADILWGVNGHPLTAYPGARTEDQLDYIKDLGMKSYRVNIPGTDKLKDLAELVKAGKERQIEILPSSRRAMSTSTMTPPRNCTTRRMPSHSR